MSDPDGQYVDDLASHLEPMVTVMLELVDAALDLAPPSGLPAADSQAMAERAVEDKYANEHWPEPVRAAHAVTGVLVFAAGDHIRSYARLFASEPVPVYTHLAIARAALDAAGTAYWLADTGISDETRIMRYEVTRLMSAVECKRSPMPSAKAKSQEIVDNVRAGAAPHGWTVNRSNPHCGNQEEPRPKQLIRRVLEDDAIFGPDAPGIATVLWWYLSGVTHSASYALMQSVKITDDAPNAAPGETMAAISTSSQSVFMMGLTAARGYAAAVQEHAQLMGWSSERWDAARKALADLGATLAD